ncbi:MAG: helix-turn-helix domain-containing protein [Dermatophilaceae bacterium]
MGRGVPDEGGVTVLGGTVAVAVAVAEADGRPNSTKGAGMPQREREGQPGPARSDAAPVGDQARALGHPSRYAIFEQLRLARRALVVADLARVIPLRPNAIRLHLATLRDAGLVVEETSSPRGRGRPAHGYRLSAGAIERWDASGPHEELSLMLLDLLKTRRSPREVGRDAGERLAADVSGRQSGAVDALVGVARRLGFDPDEVAAARAPQIVLRNCPFAVGAERAPEVVCELHRGIADGVCRAAGGTWRVARLVVREPSRAGCRLILEAAPA